MKDLPRAVVTVKFLLPWRGARIAAVVASAAVWCVAWFMAAYIQADDSKDVITGGLAFQYGLLLSPIVLIGAPLLWLAWSANIAYLIALILLLRGKATRKTVYGAVYFSAILPIGAYFPGSLMFSNENDIGEALIGPAVWLWHAALVIAAMPLLIFLIKVRTIQDIVMVNDTEGNSSSTTTRAAS
ncbi:MAG: hypothetical protein Q4A34_03450 [Candidatus Saccharibacteria bacterium]|nr:hypothetical protein [Candidatus Saccharibacteria bacterium]